MPSAPVPMAVPILAQASMAPKHTDSPGVLWDEQVACAKRNHCNFASNRLLRLGKPLLRPPAQMPRPCSQPLQCAISWRR
jgi:hypothetical protein